MIGSTSDGTLGLAHFTIDCDCMGITGAPGAKGAGFDPIRGFAAFVLLLLLFDPVKVEGSFVFGVVTGGEDGILPFDALWG